MVLQDGKVFGGIRLHLRIGAQADLPLHIVYVFHVVADHLVFIRRVELGSAFLSQPIYDRLFLVGNVVRQFDSLARRQMCQFLIGLRVVVNHLLTKLFDLRVGRTLHYGRNVGALRVVRLVDGFEKVDVELAQLRSRFGGRHTVWGGEQQEGGAQSAPQSQVIFHGVFSRDRKAYGF